MDGNTDFKKDSDKAIKNPFPLLLFRSRKGVFILLIVSVGTSSQTPYKP